MLLAPLLWLGGCSLVGFLVAVLYREHGAIVFAILGVAIGLCGAVTHVALLCVSRFRSLLPRYQSVVVWACAVGAFLALGVVLGWSRSDIITFALWVALPALLGTMC